MSQARAANRQVDQPHVMHRHEALRRASISHCNRVSPGCRISFPWKMEGLVWCVVAFLARRHQETLPRICLSGYTRGMMLPR